MKWQLNEATREIEQLTAKIAARDKEITELQKLLSHRTRELEKYQNLYLDRGRGLDAQRALLDRQSIEIDYLQKAHVRDNMQCPHCGADRDHSEPYTAYYAYRCGSVDGAPDDEPFSQSSNCKRLSAEKKEAANTIAELRKELLALKGIGIGR